MKSMELGGSRIVVAAALCLAFATTRAPAQTVYRCGAEGRTYSQQPCIDGTPVDASDTRTNEQRAQAGRAAAREKALADNLERDRLATEAHQRAAMAAASFRARAVASTASEPERRHVVRHRVVR